jgi:aminopeptidase
MIKFSICVVKEKKSMTDPRMKKLAELLVNYSVEVQPGEWVVINANVAAMPLINQVYREVIKAGGNPSLLLSSDEMDLALLEEGNEDQLKWISPATLLSYEKVAASITLGAADNSRTLTGVDPDKQKTHSVVGGKRREIYLDRTFKKELRWTSTRYPCPAYAQEADMSLKDYENFVYKATFCDQDDPVAEWMKVHEEQQKIIDWLEGKKTVSVKSPNADLTLSIEGRTFINSDGKRNMPSGEIFTGPVEDSANGWVEFTYPAIREGREVEGVRLEFKGGEVVKASAKKNEAYLLSQLEVDEGARYLGEWAIGTNYGIQKFTKSILYDEKIGGSFHMAVGAGYPETGSKNKSLIHWDFICDIRQESEVRVDGDLLYKDGQFVI